MIKLHTNFGVIAIELDAEKAPLSAANFLAYAQAGHYDNTIFHRVIPGFMIQGGGFEPGMKQKPCKDPIKNEADNGLKNVRGTIAMARTSVVDSATSQFFVNLVDNDFLDHSAPTPRGWGYAVFGKVTGGMETVDLVARVPTGSRGAHADVPSEQVVIESIKVVE